MDALQLTLYFFTYVSKRRVLHVVAKRRGEHKDLGWLEEEYTKKKIIEKQTYLKPTHDDVESRTTALVPHVVHSSNELRITIVL